MFYGLIFAALLYIFYPSISKYELQSSFKSIVILAAAAGSFMTIYLLFALLRDKVRLRQWGAGCIAVFFLLLLNPIVNIPHIMFQSLAFAIWKKGTLRQAQYGTPSFN
ncbi:hypothetical protein [Bacillus sp. 28A-2]|uniref:hypothetical protein n=1 Tax=Bacillus sp. 28A-2 TaxID=2772252 RepID=UPI001CD188D5|nr:hypothetical protein [Bacillus sp. 28A-2]